MYRLGKIHQDALLETVPTGAMQVTFDDSSVLTLGSNSRLRVDRFVYATNGPGEQSLGLARGVFRFVSGTIPKNAVRLTTPSVSIGIRGTILKVRVNDDGSGTVYFEHGQGFVENREGRHVPVGEGERVDFSAKAGSVSLRRPPLTQAITRLTRGCRPLASFLADQGPEAAVVLASAPPGPRPPQLHLNGLFAV